MKKIIVVIIFLVNLIGFAQSQTVTNLGIGLDNYARTLYADTTTGLLYVGGNFDHAGGIPVYHNAIWDGINWVATDSTQFWGMLNITKFQDTIYASSILPGGIMKWDGVNWNSICNNCIFDAVGMIATDSLLYIAGCTDTIGGFAQDLLYSFDGYNLSTLPSLGADPGWCAAIPIILNNEIYLVGNFLSATNPQIEDIGIFNGTNWNTVGNTYHSSFAFINTSVIYQNKLIVGGQFKTAWGDPGNGIAAWNGSTWSQLGIGIDNGLYDLKVYNNELYAAGIFQSAGGIPVSNIAKWDGIQWHSLGLTMNGAISSMAFLNSELYITGAFTEVNGMQVNHICKISLPVSDGIFTLNNLLTVTPNPTNGTIWINYQFQKSRDNYIKIINLSGKEIFKTNLQTDVLSQSIELPSSIYSGMYSIAISDGINVVYKKLMLIK